MLGQLFVREKMIESDKLLVIFDRIYERQEVTDDDLRAGVIRALIREGLVGTNGQRLARYGWALTKAGEHKLTELRTIAGWRQEHPQGWRPS